MSNIQKYSEAQLQALSHKEQEMVLTYQQPTIWNANTKDLKMSLNDAISMAYFNIGAKTPITEEEQKARANDIFTLINVVLEDLQSDSQYNSLRCPELLKAIKNGSLGKYNDDNFKFIGVSAINIITSIRKYLANPERNENVSAYMRLTQKSEEKAKPSEIELKIMKRENIINAYKRFVKKGWTNDPGNMMFQELTKLGQINYSDNQIVDFYKIAKERLIKYYDPEKHLDKFKRRECKQRQLEIIKLTTAQLFEDKELQSEVCLLALNKFFANLKEMEMPIEDIFCEEED